MVNDARAALDCADAEGHVWTSVILDYGLVLCLPPTTEAVDRMAGVFGIDHGTFWSLYEKNRGPYDRGDLDGTEYWSRFASEAGISIDEDATRSLRIWDIEMWSRLNEPLLRWARNLRSAGYRTAVLSNLHTEFTTHVRKNCPWFEYFDYPVFCRRSDASSRTEKSTNIAFGSCRWTQQR